MIHDYIERLFRRILTMIGGGRITSVKDDGSVQLLQIRTGPFGVQDDVPRIGEYGLASYPPVGSDAVVLFVAGNATEAIAVATANQTHRPRNLASGEVMLFDNRGQRVYLSAAGIRIVGAGLPIEVTTTGSLKINATTLEVTANTTFTGTVMANGKRIDNLHTHVPDSRGDIQGPVQ